MPWWLITLILLASTCRHSTPSSVLLDKVDNEVLFLSEGFVAFQVRMRLALFLPFFISNLNLQMAMLSSGFVAGFLSCIRYAAYCPCKHTGKKKAGMKLTTA